MPDELTRIAQQIVARGWTEHEWADRESDDEFQTSAVVGGFDTTEMAFTFSIYDEERTEWWAQLSLDEMHSLAQGRLADIPLRPAE